ncbi:MAG: hypothetical protein IT318_24800 [Anaerolineales bacterium]|nr:hypothetical protein [Anaerolineales bacterium]
MSLAAHLVHRCTIQRLRNPVPDGYQADQVQWADWLTDVPCRLVTKAQRVASDDRTQLAVLTSSKLLLPAGTDVAAEDCQVVNIVIEGGQVLAGPFGIAAVLPRRARTVHHVTVELESGP